MELLGDEQSIGALVYPNPTSDYLHIPASGQHTQVRIMSVTGAEMMQVKLQEGDNRLNVSQLPKGIYTIEVYDGQKQLYQRFVKE